jgi:tropomyosin-1
VLENKSNMEDDRVAILEAQLAQAKLIAEEADKKYEEVSSSVVVVFALLVAAPGIYHGCIPPTK